MGILCPRSISSTLFPSYAPRAWAPSSFARTLDCGATVRSPNCDLRGSSVTCASHGGTMERLARMLQRSLDPARNGFYGLSVPGTWSNTGIRAIRSPYGVLQPIVRSLRAGVTARRFWRQIGCPDLVQASNGHRRGRGRTSREESKEEQALSSSRRTHRLIFLLFFLLAIAPGPGPFRAAPSSCADPNLAKQSSAASLLTAAIPSPGERLAFSLRKGQEAKNPTKKKPPNQRTEFMGCRTTSKRSKLYCDRRGGGRIGRMSRHCLPIPYIDGHQWPDGSPYRFGGLHEDQEQRQ